jgi:Holliday junction resolvase RusA-like endonuclease
VIIKLQGPIVSKKNLLRRSKNGGMFRDTAIAKQIEAITWQAKAQWGNREPLDRPKISAMFIVTDERSDIDNKWTTVLDCLVAGGVLINDNIKHGPRPQTIDWRKSVIGEEGCLVEIEEI